MKLKLRTGGEGFKGESSPGFFARNFPLSDYRTGLRIGELRANTREMLLVGTKTERGRELYAWLVEVAQKIDSPLMRNEVKQEIARSLKIVHAAYPDVRIFSQIQPKREKNHRLLWAAEQEAGRFEEETLYRYGSRIESALLDFALYREGKAPTLAWTRDFELVATKGLAEMGAFRSLEKVLEMRDIDQDIARLAAAGIARSDNLDSMERAILGARSSNHPRLAEIVDAIGTELKVSYEERAAGQKMVLREISSKEKHEGNLTAEELWQEIRGIRTIVERIHAISREVIIERISPGTDVVGMMRLYGGLDSMAGRIETEAPIAAKELIRALKALHFTIQEDQLQEGLGPNPRIRRAMPRELLERIGNLENEGLKGEVRRSLSEIEEATRLLAHGDAGQLVRLALNRNSDFAFAAPSMLLEKGAEAIVFEGILQDKDIDEFTARSAANKLLCTRDVVSCARVLRSASESQHPQLEAIVDSFARSMRVLSVGEPKVDESGPAVSISTSISMESVKALYGKDGTQTLLEVMLRICDVVAEYNRREREAADIAKTIASRPPNVPGLS